MTLCPCLLAGPHNIWGAEVQPLCQVREIYETAIEEQEDGGLSDEDCKKMCLRYAALERRLGEIDRARAIFVHASSLADPRTDPGFWGDWNDFEVKHGNEDTFRSAVMHILCRYCCACSLAGLTTLECMSVSTALIIMKLS